VHHLDEGDPDGPVVLLLHGEPSWSYLYRHMIPVLVEGGCRVIAPDLVGFGRSDKPVEQSAFTYERHVAWLAAHVFDALDLTDVTLVAQDWGGLLGLRLVAAAPARFDRVVIANTGLPDGQRPMTEAFLAWQRYAATAEDFRVGKIVASGCSTPLDEAVIAAYDAPFHVEAATAGARVFPSLVPTTPTSPSAAENVAARAALEQFDRPFLTAFSDLDPTSAGAERWFQRHVPGAVGRAHPTIHGGGHFLQEDRGPELATVVLDFMAGGS
jgi:haloalkane dehalogenase